LKKLGHILGPGECFPHFADLIFFCCCCFSRGPEAGLVLRSKSIQSFRSPFKLFLQ